MVRLLGETLRHPVVSRLGGISLGAVLVFAVAIGSYKNTIDTMAKDLELIKPVITQIQMDVAVLKARP